MSRWTEHAVFWHVYPLGFVGAEPSANTETPVSHRLHQLTAWLDYAVRLGASGVLLGPVFSSSTHGYDTIDYFRIDPRLGDGADFDELIAAARARGLRVVLDGVFNHVGREFPPFQAALADRAAPESTWFRGTVRPGTSEVDYATFEGHSGLIALNHESAEVEAFVVRVMNHWLERGISGWRLDAAYAVPRDFWARVLPQVRAVHPDAYIVGEVIHGDYAGFVRDTTMDAVTQYELWKAIWSALNDRNLFELAWALERHARYLDTFAPLTFVGNHDVTRLASRLTDSRHIAHALVVLLTVGGTPCIYSGDEQAFRGIKEERAGGDDAVRPAFPHSPDDLATDGWPTYRLHQRLIGLRRRHPWLHRATSRMLHLRNQQMLLAVERGKQRLIVALNLDDGVAVMPVPEGSSLLEGDGAVTAPNTSAATVRVPGHGWAILATPGSSR